MKIYDTPEINVIGFSEQDVIRTSPPIVDWGDFGDNPYAPNPVFEE